MENNETYTFCFEEEGDWNDIEDISVEEIFAMKF
jgi:hypothetical protein